jgi:DamX protein
MVENDIPVYQAKRLLINQKSRAFNVLITQEQIQKLELLIHLISNSKQAVVICGSEGIGKSTMLKVLQERKIDAWLYCHVQGNEHLSFEKIQEQIVCAIKQDKKHQKIQYLSGAFRLIESQHKKIVLMIDDAGHLAPGLINSIIDYATEHTVLRVIFVLTHDELDLKNGSDSAIDNCHLIEIPPLSKKQCGEYLQHLAAKTRSQIAFNEINDHMIEAVYQQTQGIPSRIIAELPALKNNARRDNSLQLLVAAVVGLVVLALGTQWFSASEYNIKPTQISAPVAHKSVDIANDTPLTANHSQPDDQAAVQIDNATSDQPSREDVIRRALESGAGTLVKNKTETEG